MSTLFNITIQLKSRNANYATSVTINGEKFTGTFLLESVLARLIESYGPIAVEQKGLTVFASLSPLPVS